jgi:hypothetical protein
LTNIIELPKVPVPRSKKYVKTELELMNERQNAQQMQQLASDPRIKF